MKPIKVQITIDSIRARQDRSLGMSISTPELDPTSKVLFMELQGILCECTIKPIDSESAPVEIKTEKDIKSSSQVLRGKLFRLFKLLEERQKVTDTFEIWYINKMASITNQIQLKIDELEQ